MPKTKNITVIPATLNRHTGIPKSANIKRRIAGYTRVSTDSDEQFTSYAAQVDYYTSYIKSKGCFKERGMLYLLALIA